VQWHRLPRARDPLKPSRILEHGNVVEQHVTRDLFYRYLPQLLQLLVAVPVTKSRPPVKPKIAEPTGHGVLVKWVNAMHEAQLLAKLPHFFSLPFAARLPDALEWLRPAGREQFRLDLTKERAQVRFIRWRGTKPRRTLKKDAATFQRARTLEGAPPGIQDRRIQAKGARFAPLLRAELFAQAPLSGTTGLVGDDLPGLQSKLKARRYRAPPLLEGAKLMRLVKRLLHLHYRKFLGVAAQAERESATTHTQTGRRITIRH
jgi:hypothetical protein